MNAAVDEELIDTQPGQHPRRRGGATQARHRTGLIGGASAVIVEAMPERFRLMVLLATWCALRYGELAELRRKDVDLAHGVIKVRRAVSFVPGATIVGPPKTEAGIRDVAVPPHLHDALRHHLDEFTKPDATAWLFRSDMGRHLHESVLYRYWNTACKAAGRAELRFHDLRHTAPPSPLRSARPRPSSSPPRPHHS